jgi:hypothetical protein
MKGCFIIIKNKPVKYHFQNNFILILILVISSTIIFSACEACTNAKEEKPSNTHPPSYSNRENKNSNKKDNSQQHHQNKNDHIRKRQHPTDNKEDIYSTDEELEQALSSLKTEIVKLKDKIESIEKSVNNKVQRLSKSYDIAAGTIEEVKQVLQSLQIIDRKKENEIILYEKVLTLINKIEVEYSLPKDFQSVTDSLKLDLEYLKALTTQNAKIEIEYGIKASAKRIDEQLYTLLKEPDLPVDIRENVKLMLENQKSKKKNTEDPMSYIYKDTVNFIQGIQLQNSLLTESSVWVIKGIIFDFDIMTALETL